MARRTFGALALLVVATVLSGTLVACGSTSKRGLVIGAEQEPDCFDWLDACSGSQWGTWTAQLETEPMAFRSVVQNGQLVTVPGAVLAGEPKFTTTPVETITYAINPAAVWSDGVAITCADFQYTADQEQHGKNLYDQTGYLDIDKVSCPTPKTVVVTYKKGKTYASWDSLFASTVGILPSHLLKGKDRDKALKDGYTWSGGPWFAKWNKGDSIVLTRNDKYWGPKAKLPQVTFQFETDTAAEFEAFKSGQVDAIYPQPQVDVVDAIKAGLPGAHTLYQAKTATVEALWFNTARFPFDSKAVRQALGYAIDRDALVNKLFGLLGVTTASNSLNPFVVAAYSDQNAWARYHLDLTQVTSLMTGDGWAKGSDGIWAKNGKRAAFTIVSTAGNKLRELAEQILQPELKTAGFDMAIKNTSSDNLFGKALPDGSYQVALYGNQLTSVTPGLCVSFCTENIPGPANDNSGLNTGFVSIPAADVQMRITDTSLDDNARKVAAKKADDILADYDVALPLDPLPDIAIWSDRVTGPISDNPIESMFWNLDQWELK